MKTAREQIIEQSLIATRDQTCFDVSLFDHNDLITDAAYVNSEDCCYFVIRDNDSFIAVICDAFIDAEKVEFLMCDRATTLDAAIEYVEQQYCIDTSDTSDTM